jgi:hypothetical protein
MNGSRRSDGWTSGGREWDVFQYNAEQYRHTTDCCLEAECAAMSLPVAGA